MKLDIAERLSRLKNTSEKLVLDAKNGQKYKIQKISEKGFRKTMEDEDVVFSTSPELNTDKLGQAMVTAITDMSQKVKRLYPTITTGSAVAMVAITPDLKAVCTDLGDSFVVAYVWDSQTKKVTHHVINTQHSAGSQSEFERIKQEGGYVTAEIYEGIKCDNLLYPTKLTDESLPRIEQIKKDCDSKNIPYQVSYRVCGEKAIARGVNANDYKTSVPEVKVTDLKALMKNKDDRIFLCVTCDGMFELNCLTPQIYATLIEDSIAAGKEELIPVLMKDIALNCNNESDPKKAWGSSDNLTILWSEIPTKGLAITLFKAVYDGFGGSLVAMLLKGELHKLVINNLTKANVDEQPVEASRLLVSVSVSSSSSDLNTQTALATQYSLLNLPAFIINGLTASIAAIFSPIINYFYNRQDQPPQQTL